MVISTKIKLFFYKIYPDLVSLFKVLNTLFEPNFSICNNFRGKWCFQFRIPNVSHNLGQKFRGYVMFAVLIMKQKEFSYKFAKKFIIFQANIFFATDR